MIVESKIGGVPMRQKNIHNYLLNMYAKTLNPSSKRLITPQNFLCRLSDKQWPITWQATTLSYGYSQLIMAWHGYLQLAVLLIHC